MIALWDTTGNEVVRALAAERRNAGGVASGLALTLVAVVAEPRVREAEAAAATAAATHPCRLLIVVRSPSPATSASNPESRLDAEIVVGGRLGPAEAVVMRMHGRLTRHAESVVIPLLAPDVPVVTWWHDTPPDRIATDALGVFAERRITDVAQAPDPIAALRQRAVDFAPGDTDLSWTRTTPWRTLLAGALDTATATVAAASVTAPATDPTAALLRGWLTSRLGVPVDRVDEGEPVVSGDAGSDAVQSVSLRLANGEEITIARADGSAVLRRTGLPDRPLPLIRRQLGDHLAEELRRLDADQPYAAALAAATGVTDLAGHSPTRIYIWHDPAPVVTA
ncbi:MAG TPA: glucose-6-phosphate dehydrogenase assembly protein OpcA [Micromonosporaceae bacterium]